MPGLFLFDGQIDEARCCGQGDIKVPDPEKVSLMLHGKSAEPGSEKAANLMGKQRQAKKRRKISRTEQLAHYAGCGGHSRQPGEACGHGKLEYTPHELTDRQGHTDFGYIHGGSIHNGMYKQSHCLPHSHGNHQNHGGQKDTYPHAAWRISLPFCGIFLGR